MISSKLFAIVVTASTLWVVDGKWDSPATSSSVSYFTSSGDDAHVFSSTDPLSPSRLTETASSGISESSTTPSYQIPTSSPTVSDSTTTSALTISSDIVIIKASTFSSSETTILSVEITTLGDSSTTTDTITASIDDSSLADVSSSTEVSTSTGVSASTEVSTSTGAPISTHSTTCFETTISTDLATSTEQTATTDSTTYTTIPTQSTSAELSDTTETTVPTYITTSTDVTTTASTTVFTSEITTTTEILWTSTTAASCPVYSVSLNDPSFEGDNTGPDRWDYMGQFAGVAVPFQRENSVSEKIPRAHTGNQFALLSGGPGSTLGSDMWRPMSLDPTKKYQVWFTFAAVSDPDEDWNFNFIISTRKGGHASRENIIVPKGSPFVYRQQSTIIRGAQGDNLYAFMRVTSGSNPRLVAVDDIYVVEYAPLCSVPTTKSDPCGGIQSLSINTQAYRTVYLDQGTVEICAQLCIKDESCETFGWRVEQFGRSCYLYKAPMESLGIKPSDRGALFYDRSCGQCTGLDCYPS